MMKKIALGTVLIVIGIVGAKAHFSTNAEAELLPITEEELMRYTEADACIGHAGQSEPEHIVH